MVVTWVVGVKPSSMKTMFDNMRICMTEVYSVTRYKSGESEPINVCKVDTTRALDTSDQSPAKNQGGHIIMEVWSVDSIASNSMKSSNPHSGFHKSKVIKTLDTSVPDPSKNQGGHIIMEDVNTFDMEQHYNPQPSDTFQLTTKNCSHIRGDSPLIKSNTVVRRLTPVECERLQGFPSIIKRSVFSICYEYQKNYVSVEIKSHKLQSNVYNAEESVRQELAQYAENNLQNDLERKKQLVVVRVQINCGQMVVGELNREKFTSLANGVEQKNLFLQSIRQEDFAQEVVHISQTVEKITSTGKEGLLQQVMPFIHHQNGDWLAGMCGQENEVFANDAENTQNVGTMSTMLSQNQNIQNSDSTEQTLFYSVLNVISLFIQKKIQLSNSFEIWFEVEDGYTNIPWRNKPIAPDSRRYKALGNSMAVPVMRWIGKRIQESQPVVYNEEAIRNAMIKPLSQEEKEIGQQLLF
jgi:site-specific DNA-cytosine methylase